MQRQKLPFKHLVSTVTCSNFFLGRWRIWTVSFTCCISFDNNKILLKLLACSILGKKKKKAVFLLYQELHFLLVFLLLPKNKTPGRVFRRSEHLKLPPTSATILFWTLPKTRPAAQWFLLLMKYTQGFLTFTQNLWFYSVSLKIHIRNVFIIIFPVSERWDHVAHIWIYPSKEFMSFMSEVEIITLGLEIKH